MTQLLKSKANALLGYPDDARLLILNADDFGLCHAINAGIFGAMKDGLARSTSLMVPCPWALHAMQLLRENPELSFGVHLTAICDMAIYRWTPLAPKDKVPSLIDDTGYFYSLDRMAKLLEVAKLNEVELEFRLQIETALAAGLKPTHLDWHCLHNGGRDDILDLTMGLAKEYRLALRISGHPLIETLLAEGRPVNEHEMVDSYDIDPTTKPAQYAQMLRSLPAGLSEWAVHPALDTPELNAMEPGPKVRYTDYEFLMSSEAQEIIRQEGIVLVNYKPLQTLWQDRAASS
jgi:chitin disaccharide deacetylase